MSARVTLREYTDSAPASRVMENAEGFTYDPNAPPPAFGHAMRKYWGFDDKYVNVNHGKWSRSLW